MMLAHQCSARAYLAVLIAVMLSVLLLTAHRLHIGTSLNLPHLVDRPVTNKPEPEEPKTQQLADLDAQAAAQRADFCDNDWKFLRSKELGLSEKVIYSRRCVKPVYGNVNRDAVGKIADPLINDPVTLDMKADCGQFTPPPCEPLTLEVPRPFPPHADQYGYLAFGIASNYERVEKSLPSFAHWLSGTGAQLVAVIADADDDGAKHDLRALEKLYRDHGINATIIAPKLKESMPRKNHKEGDELRRPAAVEQLHFLLIRDMLDVSSPQTQWLGVLDDDTFFPALDPLSRRLHEHDHTRPLWLGALADNWISVKSWGFMAFGGAGTFLSMPLAKQLEPELENCIRETTIKTGDGMLRDCVYQRTATKLTLVDGLYQHDFWGDPSGFFESGRRALSLHHWKSWYKAPVVEMAAVAHLCGDCFLQRWGFGKDTLLANGYSITVYREGLDQLDLTRMEGTFRDADNRYDFVYGPFRPRLGDDQKKSYRLLGVDGGTEKGDRFRQAYVHRAKRDEEGIEPVDEVVELVWEV
ncbi:glycosyltransferase family 31 protein [Chaetomium fimeti]|uniref:Glycosyltransferase family 31 protein n=1 Tax=Chaetomium fimeti TaxID=1854472 RepID=A0AAE0H8J3_9PEZI|nr:glycosyltransferase family 31 protein [Chaetomium fimeti]